MLLDRVWLSYRRDWQTLDCGDSPSADFRRASGKDLSRGERLTVAAMVMVHGTPVTTA